MEKIARERIERAARLYSSNQDANRALGIAAGTFGRLCRQYGKRPTCGATDVLDVSGLMPTSSST